MGRKLTNRKIFTNIFFGRFVCVANLQESKKCNDFEVRFCCPQHTNSNPGLLSPLEPRALATPEKPVVKGSFCDLQNLTMNDIRKLNL